MQTELPGVVALIKQGVEIYKQEYKPIIQLTLLNYLIMLGGFTIAAILLVVGFHSRAAVSIPVLIGVGILLGIIFIALLVWIALRVTLAIRFAILRHGTSPSASSLWSEGKGRVGSFLWIAVLCFVWVFGPAIVVAAAAFVLGLLGGVSTAAAFISGSCALLVAGIVIGTKITFSGWVYVDRDVRGVEALRESSAMVKGRFGKVFWTLLGLALIFFGLQLVLQIIVDVIFSPTGKLGVDIVNFIESLFYQLTLYPIWLAAVFSFYASLKTKATPTDVPEVLA